MQKFSLLQTLQDASEVPAPAPVLPAVVDYHVYVVDMEGVETKVGVPAGEVPNFEAHFEANPSDLASFEEHLSRFKAIVV